MGEDAGVWRVAQRRGGGTGEVEGLSGKAHCSVRPVDGSALQVWITGALLAHTSAYIAGLGEASAAADADLCECNGPALDS